MQENVCNIRFFIEAYIHYYKVVTENGKQITDMRMALWRW